MAGALIQQAIPLSVLFGKQNFQEGVSVPEHAGGAPEKSAFEELLRQAQMTVFAQFPHQQAQPVTTDDGEAPLPAPVQSAQPDVPEGYVVLFSPAVSSDSVDGEEAAAPNDSLPAQPNLAEGCVTLLEPVISSDSIDGGEVATSGESSPAQPDSAAGQVFLPGSLMPGDTEAAPTDQAEPVVPGCADGYVVPDPSERHAQTSAADATEPAKSSDKASTAPAAVKAQTDPNAAGKLPPELLWVSAPELIGTVTEGEPVDRVVLSSSGGVDQKDAPIPQPNPVAVVIPVGRPVEIEQGLSDGSLKNHSETSPPPPGIPTGPVQQTDAAGSSVQPVQQAVQMEHVVDQIVQSVRLSQRADTTELHVQLKPDFLGRLSIRISSDLHGLRMEIKAENDMVRQIMQDNMAGLHQQLANKGIVLDHMAFLTDPGWTNRRQPERPAYRTYNAPGAGLEKSVEQTSEAGLPASLSLVDYLA